MAYMKRETNQYMKSAGNESAANALVQLGDSADSALIACLKDADTKVREAVTHAIANTKEPRFVVPLIDVLTDATSTGRQRFEAAKGLGEVKDPRAIDALRKCTRGPEGEWLIGPTYSASYGDLDVACEAANALKKLGWQPRDRNEEAYFWLCSRSRLEIALNADRVREVIVAEAKAPRKDRMTRAVYLAIEIGNEDTVTGLIGALNEGGDVTMAETFLNCGHSGLAQAAKDWATANGFKITAGNGAQKARWGRL
jgi:HEAT repeat protein